MDNLKNVMLYFIKHFPQKLGRTKLIKAIYLLDCEWYRIHRRTYTGLEYKRDQNGPFDATFYEAKNALCAEGLIYERLYYYYVDSPSYEFELNEDKEFEIVLHPIAERIAEKIVETLKYEDLKTFLDLAYNTPPMLSIRSKEKGTNRLYGEALPMSELNKPLEPLFTLDEVKEALKKIDFSKRGTDEEYNEAIFAEYISLHKTRERVREAWESIGEK